MGVDDAARVATAGWAIPAGVRESFPADGTTLQRYAGILTAVEINSSFHRPHRLQTWARWAATTPPGFRFAVKLPRTITHELRLSDCDDAVGFFAAEVAGLGDKLGVVLAQLPPSFAFPGAPAVAALQSIARACGTRLALEPRHASWFDPDIDAALADAGIARVAVDPAVAPAAGSPSGWRGLAYWRWHGSPAIYRSSYAGARLTDLARAVGAASGAERWVIFDNTASGAALGDALALAATV